MLSGQFKFPVGNLCDLLEEIKTDNNMDEEQKIKIVQIRFLLKSIRIHHLGTYVHSLNVARLTAWMARELGLSQQKTREITLAALMHDLGKTRIDPVILDKPYALTLQEWETIRKHPEFGVNILNDYQWIDSMRSLILFHHERLDGSGYFGLSGNKIPFGCKIISLADAFDAMYSSRPYQIRRSLQQCCKELERHSGTQFDPDLATTLISIASKIKLI